MCLLWQARFAHLEFRDEKSADDAHKVLSGKTVGDRVLTLDYFGAKSNHPSSKKPFSADQLDPCKLFVSRYPLDTTSEELQVLFPTATSVEVLRKQQGQPIGWGYVAALFLKLKHRSVSFRPVCVALPSSLLLCLSVERDYRVSKSPSKKNKFKKIHNRLLICSVYFAFWKIIDHRQYCATPHDVELFLRFSPDYFHPSHLFVVHKFFGLL